MQKAIFLFNEMNQSGDELQPDLITFSTVIKGFCKTNDMQKAFEIAQQMITN